MDTTFREPVKRAVFRCLKILGYYADYRQVDHDFIRKEMIGYCGDVPTSSTGDELETVRFRAEYKITRPRCSLARDILYTERGMAWKGRCLQRSLSIEQPSLTKDFGCWPRRSGRQIIASGTIVECEYPITYGDWVLEHIATLAMNSDILIPPLLLPKSLMERQYVRRDLELLRIDTLAVTEPVVIGEVLGLHKQIYSHHWTEDAAYACRRAYRADPIQPRRHSAIYLCREGERAASVERAYPHAVIREVMKDLNVRIVYSKGMSLDDFRRLALDAETVIADHGSALCNLILWHTRNVIELFTDRWWNGYFIFLANALGVERYALVNVDGINSNRLREKLRGIGQLWE